MPTIAGIATGNPNFSVLVSVLQFLDTNLGTTLVATLDDDATDLTVFAPTNAAFVDLALDLGYDGNKEDLAAVTQYLATTVDTPLLLDVVQYHLSPIGCLSTEFFESEAIATLNGTTIGADLPVLIDREPDLIDPSVVVPNVVATNGVVHGIDKVLLPIDLSGNNAPTITGLVAASGPGFDHNGGDFDILLEAVTTAGLADALDNSALDATVFAPTDDAFVGLAQALGFEGGGEAKAWDYLVESLALLGAGDPGPILDQVLKFHVVTESLQASQVLTTMSFDTLQGGMIGRDGVTLIDADPDLPDPSIIATDIQASNGVVHAIDGVLLPADLLQSDGSNDVDFIVSGSKSDRIFAGNDNDFVDGNGGNDVINAGRGDDVVLGGAGRDLLFGQKGDDILLGESGNDIISAGSGDDNLDGGAGRDRLLGGSGNDVIDTGTGNDLAWGGSGADVFIFEKGDGRDVIRDFNVHEDSIDLSGHGFSGYDDIEHAIFKGFFGTWINLGDGDQIILTGLFGVPVEESNFVF